MSMKRVAEELGVTPMALYHHVANKGQLIDLMADYALRSLPELDLTAPWDSGLEKWFGAYHRLFMAHPAVAEVITRRPLEGPTASRHGDRILECLLAAGFSDDDAVALFVDLVNYTVGASLFRLGRQRPDGERMSALANQDVPTAFRLRRRLARAATEKEILAGIGRIIRTRQP